MLANLPIEPPEKLTRDDFFLAKKEAPKRQAEQEKINELTEEEKQKSEKEEDANKEFDLASESSEVK